MTTVYQVKNSDILKPHNVAALLSQTEIEKLYDLFCKAIDKASVIQPIEARTQRKILFVADCKWLVRTLLENSDKSLTVSTTVTELGDNMRFSRKYLSQCLSFLVEFGLVTTVLRRCIKLHPPAKNERSIMDTYNRINSKDLIHF